MCLRKYEGGLGAPLSEGGFAGEDGGAGGSAGGGGGLACKAQANESLLGSSGKLLSFIPK